MSVAYVVWTFGMEGRQQGTIRTNCRLADVLSSAISVRGGGVYGQQCDMLEFSLWKRRQVSLLATVPC